MLQYSNWAAENYFDEWKKVTKVTPFHFLLTSTVHFTLGAKMEIKIQELLMRLRKICIFLVNDGLPVPIVKFYCSLLDVMPKGTPVEKKMEPPTLGVGSEQRHFTEGCLTWLHSLSSTWQFHGQGGKKEQFVTARSAVTALLFASTAQDWQSLQCQSLQDFWK